MKKVKAIVLKTFPDQDDMQDCIDGNIEPSDVKIYYKGEEHYVVPKHYDKSYFKIIEEQKYSNTIQTAGGQTINYGDDYFFIDNYLDIASCKYNEFTDPSKKIFSTRQAAEVELHSRITLQCEDGEVKGENVPIYSLLTKAQWQMDTYTSLQIWTWNVLPNKKGLSDKWIHFISEKNRDEYREMNMPKYSQKELDNRVDFYKSLYQSSKFDYKHGLFSKNPFRI